MTKKLSRLASRRRRTKLRGKPRKISGGTAPAAVPFDTAPSDGVRLDDCVDGHCEDYIDDPSSPAALRTFLEFARSPAHGQLLPKPHPTLYADYEGTRVRVTMASRLGDVGISTDLGRELGYERRVLVRQLANFSEVP